MTTAVMFLVIAGILLLTVVAVWLLQRSVERNGTARTSSLGDGFGNFIDVFDPGQARAGRDLKEQQNVGPVTPTPDENEDDPIRIELGPGGMPKRVRIRRER